MNETLRQPNIQEVSLSQIRPYWNNPRDNAEAVEAVEMSIKAYGYKQLIVVDTENVIIVGDTRYRALLKLGFDKVLVIVADDITQAQAREYRIIDNKASEKAVWHWGKLETELRALPELVEWNAMFPELELQAIDPDDAPMHQVTQSQVSNASNSLASNFNDVSKDREDAIKTYTCPHCGQDFDVPS